MFPAEGMFPRFCIVNQTGSPFPHQNVSLRTVLIVILEKITLRTVPPSRTMMFSPRLARLITQLDTVIYSKSLCDSVPIFKAAEEEVRMQLLMVIYWQG